MAQRGRVLLHEGDELKAGDPSVTIRIDERITSIRRTILIHIDEVVETWTSVICIGYVIKIAVH